MSNKVLGIATQIMVMAIVISVVLLFVGIGFLVLIHVCIVGRVFRRAFNAGSRGERSSESSNGLSNEDLERLPCFHFKAVDKGSSSIDCAVCLENFRVGDKCRLLPVCKHSFHAQCVDSWLLKTPICPICRTSADSCKGDGVSEDGCSNLPGVGFELRESSSVVVGIPVSSSPSPLQSISLE
ncbi:RING-H2 finger protein ATL39-like [Tasmannia lanceolata]|uniref:RING-H2 finger protein ATL39-like n=1 Tax=Tasmannia lanceolata TaxID=3420 RepID=UPI004064557C